MKIVILDGYTENPGDLSWEGFEKLGELTVYDRTPVDKIVERIGDADAVITNKTPIGKNIFDGILKIGFGVFDGVEIECMALVCCSVCNENAVSINTRLDRQDGTNYESLVRSMYI